MSWLPPYHDMGLMGTILLSFYYGWSLVLMSPDALHSRAPTMAEGDLRLPGNQCRRT